MRHPHPLMSVLARKLFESVTAHLDIDVRLQRFNLLALTVVSTAVQVNIDFFSCLLMHHAVCRECPDQPTSCSCRDDQVCILNKRSCFKCAFTSCLDTPLRCLECPTLAPQCACEDASSCVYREQTCESCAHYTCGRPEPSCPDLQQACEPQCLVDQVCVVKTNKTTGCKERKCIDKGNTCEDTSLLVDPCGSCGANEECMIEGDLRKCVPKQVEPCLLCSPPNTRKQCGAHEHLIIEPRSCHQCGVARCVSDPCYNCFTFPIPIKCASDENLVLVPPSCYDCGKYVCVKKSFPEPTCKDCEGTCIVKDILEGNPVTECLPKECVECPVVTSCSGVQCSSGQECKLTERTCNEHN